MWTQEDSDKHWSPLCVHQCCQVLASVLPCVDYCCSVLPGVATCSRVQSALIMSETMIPNTVPFRWVLWFIKVFRSSSDCNFERFKNNIETTQLLFHNLFNFLGIVLQNIMRPTFRFLKLASNFQQTPTIRSPFKDLAHNVNSYSLFPFA